MRWLSALLLLVLLAAAPARDWRATATRSADGAYTIGNPAARVKLVEYASYTCPHCAAFSRESGPVLTDRLIRSGSTSLQVRHLIRDRLDLAAAVVARCGGAARFAADHAAIFAAQDRWLERGAAFERANADRIAPYPLLAQLRAEADGAGLTEIARARGLSAAALRRCFADRPSIDRLTAMSAALPPEVIGTPTFAINGRFNTARDWATLEPLLRAQGAH